MEETKQEKGATSMNKTGTTSSVVSKIRVPQVMPEFHNGCRYIRSDESLLW